MAGASAWAAEESVLSKVEGTGSLKLCIAQGMPEVYRRATTGEWNGVFINLTHELIRWMNVKPEFLGGRVGHDRDLLEPGRPRPVRPKSCVQGPPADADRLHGPFSAEGISVVVKKEDPKKLKRAEDLNSDEVTLGVVAGTRELGTAKWLFPNAKLVGLKATSIQLPKSVRRGDADAARLPTVPSSGGWRFPKTGRAVLSSSQATTLAMCRTGGPCDTGIKA